MNGDGCDLIRLVSCLDNFLRSGRQISSRSFHCSLLLLLHLNQRQLCPRQNSGQFVFSQFPLWQPSRENLGIGRRRPSLLLITRTHRPLINKRDKDFGGTDDRRPNGNVVHTLAAPKGGVRSGCACACALLGERRTEKLDSVHSSSLLGRPMRV